MEETSLFSFEKQDHLAVSEIQIRQAEADPVEMIPCVPSTIRKARRLLANLQKVKRIDLGADVTWYVAALARAVRSAGGVVAHRPFPCSGCQRPVCALKLWDEDHFTIFDAQEESDPRLADCWSANVFAAPHHCEVRQ
jgi:hypothetical protein